MSCPRDAHQWVRLRGEGPGRDTPPQEIPARLDECLVCGDRRDADDPAWRTA